MILLSVIIIVIAFILGKYICKILKPLKHGPDSNFIKKTIFYDGDRKYKLIPFIVDKN